MSRILVLFGAVAALAAPLAFSAAASSQQPPAPGPRHVVTAPALDQRAARPALQPDSLRLPGSALWPALNPQPIPPVDRGALNPQPIPPVFR